MPMTFPSRHAPPESEDPSAAFACSAAHLLRMTGIMNRKRRRCDRDQPLSATALEDTRPFPLRDHNETVISSGARAATPSGRSREISRIPDRFVMRLISRLRSLPSWVVFHAGSARQTRKKTAAGLFFDRGWAKNNPESRLLTQYDTPRRYGRTPTSGTLTPLEMTVDLFRNSSFLAHSCKFRR